VAIDVRAAAHPGFDRIVIDLQGDGDIPGWQQQYVNAATDDAGKPVQVAGGAFLAITVNAPFNGPTSVDISKLQFVRSLTLVKNADGWSTWIVGLDSKCGVTPATLTDPTRIYVDISC
jgi:hypothetical protein